MEETCATLTFCSSLLFLLSVSLSAFDSAPRTGFSVLSQLHFVYFLSVCVSCVFESPCISCFRSFFLSAFLSLFFLQLLNSAAARCFAAVMQALVCLLVMEHNGRVVFMPPSPSLSLQFTLSLCFTSLLIFISVSLASTFLSPPLLPPQAATPLSLYKH